ncbi:MAG: hypothetical protein MJ136_07370, partial [Clostridia bacterium]|nr:hypothetical protein [Clostridia bacterium]
MGNQKDANNELKLKAGAILEDSGRVRRNAEALLQTLQRQRAQLQHKEEEEVKRQQLEQQAKAWTMPDDDVAVPAVETPAVKPAEKAPAAVQPAEAVKKEEKPVEKPAEKPAAPVVREAAKPAPKAEQPAKEAV